MLSKYFARNFNNIFLFICVYVFVCVHVFVLEGLCIYVCEQRYMCEIQRMTCGNQFSPSITWVLGMALRPSGLTAGAFTYLTDPSTYLNILRQLLVGLWFMAKQFLNHLN